VRFPWRPAQYARTCAECGYTWRVPRSAVRRRIGAISPVAVAWRGNTVDRAELSREVQAISAQNRPAEVYRNCPKCGADHFTQRAVRGQAPDP
jgi:DNA-directed RNA polymerase subunit M/transcription elongation factor TFIIS